MAWVYDSSTLQDFLRCPRRAYWRHERELVLAEAPRQPSFGHAIHAALRSYHELWDIDRAVEVFKRHWQTPPGEELYTVERGEELLRAYAAHYGVEPFQFIALERTFELELPNGYRYCGRFDGIIEWDGTVYVYDAKTTSRLGQFFFKRWRPSLQMTGYVWAAQKLLGRPVKGVLIDALRIGTRTFAFARDISSREPWELEEFERVVTDLIATIERKRELTRTFRELSESEATIRASLWPPNWTSCGDFGMCPYRELCLCPGDDAERIAEVMYERRPWTPFEANSEEVEEVTS